MSSIGGFGALNQAYSHVAQNFGEDGKNKYNPLEKNRENHSETFVPKDFAPSPIDHEIPYDPTGRYGSPIDHEIPYDPTDRYGSPIDHEIPYDPTGRYGSPIDHEIPYDPTGRYGSPIDYEIKSDGKGGWQQVDSHNNKQTHLMAVKINQM